MAARRSWGRALRGLAALLLGGVLIAATLAVLVMGPLWRDDWVLDGVVRVVALDWRDFGEAVARERLAYELDAQGVGEQVSEADCVLVSEAGGRRVVSCAWASAVRVPGRELPLVLNFGSQASIEADGSLR